MIIEYFETDNVDTRVDLQRIDNLLQSDIFLKALSKEAPTMPLPDDFPIVTDIYHADKMMHSQDVWDMPKPWPYQYFAEITGSLNPYDYATYEEVVERDNLKNKYIDAFTELMFDFLKDKYRQLHIPQYLTKVTIIKDNDKDKLNNIILSFQNDIEAYFHYMIDAAYYGGIDASPVFRRIYEAFATGGIPCGWVGPIPVDGGDPKDCIQLLHFGKKLSA